MSGKTDKPINLVQIDQVVGDTNSDTELDYDLTSPDTLDEPIDNPQIGFDSEVSEKEESFVIYSDNRSLITRPGSDVTVKGGKKHLQRMSENLLLDVYDFQEKRIVHPDMEKYNILNTFREIRTRILQQSGGKNQVIMVVSLQHGMGATFSAVNLAAAFSYEGEKTSLIVDCDQHRRKLEKFFGDNATYGLTDYLDDNNLGTEKIIYQTGINRMRYIPVGKRRETVGEFFSSERMREFITHVKKRYSDRFIILNAPPLEVTADAAILSEVSDVIVLVVPYGKISTPRLKKALRLIPREKIVGMVINDKVKYV